MTLTGSRVEAAAASAGEGELSPGSGPIARSQWQLFRRRFVRHKGAMFGLVVLVVLFAASFGAKYWTFYDRDWRNFVLGASGPSKAHWFGTDVNGRDELTQIVYAGQISLKIGLAVAIISTLFGTFVGSVAGWFGGGFIDELFSRFTDLFLVVPYITVLAVVGKRIASSGQFLWWNLGDRVLFYKVERDLPIILALAAFGWTYVARTVRGQLLSLREKEFVEAARAAGASTPRIIMRHILPNCIGVIMVNLTLSVAGAIVAESTLSFIGFGIVAPQNSWGKMLADSEGYVGTSNVHLVYFPGLMLLLTVLAVNFLGDGLRDAFDTRSRDA